MQNPTPPLKEFPFEELRQRRHDLANEIASAQCRLWLIDDEMERRRREAESSAVRIASPALLVEVVL
jgi:hypothetical protein